LTLTLLADLRELEITPSHPDADKIRGELMHHVIANAKRCGHNIATTTAPSKISPCMRWTPYSEADRMYVTGSREFCKQVGFKEVARPVMLANGTVEAVSHFRRTDIALQGDEAHVSPIPFASHNDVD
jgi:hypothetical protein